jgi:16S rRNA (cytosine1402-N4)-methyltransferase
MLPGHVPVLVDGVRHLLSPALGEVYVDATAGLGGHAAIVGSVVGEHGTIVLNDVDPGNLERAERRVREAGYRGRLVVVRGNFAELPRRLEGEGLSADVVLADLGFSSNQIEEASRGFSFMRDGPLDMRLDPTLGVSAKDLVASASEGELSRIIADFGEDRFASRIARKVVEARKLAPITSTSELAQIVRSALSGGSSGGIDPATRTFQALRMAVNDELGCLDAFLAGVIDGANQAVARRTSWLKARARIGVISFHSLEDRRVKRAFGELLKAGRAEVLSDGVFEATEAEMDQNPRSRSAKLRAIRVGGAA